jgi:hypothetical protein
MRLTDNQITGLVLLGLVIVVLAIVLRTWLSTSADKKKTAFSWNLSTYLNILETGWRIARKNLWIFWILWIFSFLAFLQSTFLYSYFRDIPYLPTTRMFTIGSLFSFERFIRNFLLYFKRASGYMPLSFGMGPSLFFLIAVIVLIKPFQKLLFQSAREVALHPSVNFIKRNLPCFFIVTIIAVALRILWSSGYIADFSLHPSGKLKIFPGQLLSLIMIYWGTFIQTLLTGFIFSLFKSDIENGKAVKKDVFISSLKFFRPLFFFLLIFNGILHGSGFFSNILNILYRKHIPYPSFWFIIIFLLIPYLIVNRDINLKAAFKENIVLWKGYYPQILSFLFAIILIASFIAYLFSFTNVFFGTYFLRVVEMTEITLWLLFRFWIAASIMQFYSKLKEEQLIKKLTKNNVC